MKKGIAFDTLIRWLIALAILVIVIIYAYFKADDIFSTIQKVSEFLRFR